MSADEFPEEDLLIKPMTKNPQACAEALERYGLNRHPDALDPDDPRTQLSSLTAEQKGAGE